MIWDITPSTALFISREYGEGRVWMIQRLHNHWAIYLYWFSIALTARWLP